MNLKRTGRAAVSAGISLMLALAPVSPSVAFAATNSAIESTSAELEAARAHLNDLASQCETKFAELEDQQAELESTRQQITDTEGQIEVKEQELTDARAVLSQNISENYKTGINFLSFLLGSDSFDDLVSRVYYADKVAAHQNEAISTVLTIQEELDAQKATLVSSQEKHWQTHWGISHRLHSQQRMSQHSTSLASSTMGSTASTTATGRLLCSSICRSRPSARYWEEKIFAPPSLPKRITRLSKTHRPSTSTGRGQEQ